MPISPVPVKPSIMRDMPYYVQNPTKPFFSVIYYSIIYQAHIVFQGLSISSFSSETDLSDVLTCEARFNSTSPTFLDLKLHIYGQLPPKT